MPLLNFATVSNAGVDEFHAITPEIDLVFPGADFDAQVTSAMEFLSAISAGEGDTLQWIEANLAHLSDGSAGWSLDVFDDLFSTADVVAVEGSEIFAVDDETVSSLADTAESLADFFDADAAGEFADAVIDALAALAV